MLKIYIYLNLKLQIKIYSTENFLKEMYLF